MYQSLRTNELPDDYVVFDIETSGLNPKKDKIIEIGAIKYKDNKKIDEFSYLIDPEIKLNQIITDVTGITDDDLKGKDVIGGRVGGMPEMTFEWALKEHNINPKKDLNIDTSIAFAAMSSAFIGGQGDFVTLFDDNASKRK